MVRFLKAHGVVRKTQDWYGNYKRFLPAIFFVGGFIWDQLTLKRIDNWVDNLILFGYLMALGAVIVVSNLAIRDLLRWRWLNRYLDWLPLVIQFLLGGLFSAYVVFYMQSASWSSTVFFLFVLAGLLVVNEFIKNQLGNLHLQLSMYFLVSASFFIFFIPIVIRRVDYFSFWLGTCCSLVLIFGMIYFFYRKGVLVKWYQWGSTVLIILVMFVGLHVFYLKNWIPPVPLSLKFVGMFHEVSKQGDLFVLSYQKPPFYMFLRDSDVQFGYGPGSRVYCFSSVFAPTRVKDEVSHTWQFYSYEKREWETIDVMRYDIKGGREDGFRGVSFKENLAFGKWRVQVRSKENKLLGSVNFVVHGDLTASKNLVSREY